MNLLESIERGDSPYRRNGLHRVYNYPVILTKDALNSVAF